MFEETRSPFEFKKSVALPQLSVAPLVDHQLVATAVNELIVSRPVVKGLMIDPCEAAMRDDAFWVEQGPQGPIVHVSIADRASIYELLQNLLNETHPELAKAETEADQRERKKWLTATSKNLANLEAGLIKPAVTVSLYLDETFRRLGANLTLTSVNCLAALTPKEADSLLGKTDLEHSRQINLLYQCADALRHDRQHPQRLNSDTPRIERTVGELKVFTNYYITKFLNGAQAPAIYMHNAAIRVPKGNYYTTKDLLLGGTLPLACPLLGFPIYLHATTPLRSAISLGNQRNLVALLERRPPPLSNDQLDALTRLENRRKIRQLFAEENATLEHSNPTLFEKKVKQAESHFYSDLVVTEFTGQKSSPQGALSKLRFMLSASMLEPQLALRAYAYPKFSTPELAHLRSEMLASLGFAVRRSIKLLTNDFRQVANNKYPFEVLSRVEFDSEKGYRAQLAGEFFGPTEPDRFGPWAITGGLAKEIGILQAVLHVLAGTQAPRLPDYNLAGFRAAAEDLAPTDPRLVSLGHLYEVGKFPALIHEALTLDRWIPKFDYSLMLHHLLMALEDSKVKEVKDKFLINQEQWVWVKQLELHIGKDVFKSEQCFAESTFMVNQRAALSLLKLLTEAGYLEKHWEKVTLKKTQPVLKSELNISTRQHGPEELSTVIGYATKVNQHYEKNISNIAGTTEADWFRLSVAEWTSPMRTNGQALNGYLDSAFAGLGLVNDAIVIVKDEKLPGRVFWKAEISGELNGSPVKAARLALSQGAASILAKAQIISEAYRQP